MTTNESLNVPYSRCEYRKVKAIEFGVFSPEGLERMSVCKIDQTELYEKGIPKKGGLSDLRMGTIDMRFQCQTCKLELRDTKHCPGHFGHIELARPMYHIGFLSTVMKILRCVCYSCSRLLCAEDPKLKRYQNLKPRQRLAKVLELCESKKFCGADEPLNKDPNDATARATTSCGARQPKYTKDLTAASILIEIPYNEDNDTGTGRGQPELKRYFHAEEALSVLSKISNEDIISMGLNPQKAHPSWFVITVLPVPPPVVRPSVQHDGSRCEDDLTVKLLDIVKVNQQIKKQSESGAGSHLLDEYKKTLQYHVFTLVSNGIPGLPIATTKAHKPLKTIHQRLKGKEGRLRGNLMGKRVDFSARTVITGDPSLMIDEVGVPRSVAMILTYPERVTAYNKERLMKFVRNGASKYPGARYIIRDDGSRFDLRFADCNNIDLSIGWVVERHMVNNDYVLFNRQPSLHKMSIMGHKAKILPYSTFRLNLSVTSPYNADFDGDEMNLHLAQSEETRSEIKHLMLNPKQIVSPQGNKPVMGIVQDSLLGVAKMTQKDVFIRESELMNLLMNLPTWNGVIPVPAIVSPIKLWTGKQIFSLLLNDSPITLEKDNNLFKDDDEYDNHSNKYHRMNDSRVIIKNGELLSGVIDKKTVGAQSNSAVHLIWLDYGSEKTKNFLSYCQHVVNHWLLHNGFSVGCCDIVADNNTLHKVTNILNKAKHDVKQLVLEAQKGTLETQAGKSIMQSFEVRVNSILSDARGVSGLEASNSLDDKNNIIAMVLSGSKGSSLNISQIIACVGQQNVEGKRIPFGFQKRTLPHFTKDDLGPESKGFVENSYLSGLTPQEFFFHAMGGREGVIDTACKTAETGYIQRRLIKALEDARVHYDRTVRTGNNEILQFMYGEDAMSGEFIEQQELSIMKLSLDEMRRFYYHNYNDGVLWGSNWLSDSNRERILNDPSLIEVLDDEYRKLMEGKEFLCKEVFTTGDARQYLPINIGRILTNVKEQIGHENPMTLSPIDICLTVESLVSNLIICAGDDNISVEAQKNALSLLEIHIRSNLSSKKLLSHHKLGDKGFEYVIGEIKKVFQRSLAHAGEVVGTIAAQSVGEPATQMTLNTFHFAGIGSKNVTLGVPRLKEIINVAKNIRTPSLTVYLDDEHSSSRENAKLIQSKIEYTKFSNVTSFTQIIYDANPLSTIIKKDQAFVQDYFELALEEYDTSNLSPWVLRLELREKIITDKNIDMKDVENVLLQYIGDDAIHVICSDFNAEDLVVRIRLKRNANVVGGASGSSGKKSYDNEDGDDNIEASEHLLLSQIEKKILSELALKGINGIKKVYMRTNRSDRNAPLIYDNQTGKFSKREEWILDTDGVNLKEVLQIEGVDYKRTTSNDLLEIISCLGIEAARKALLKELRSVLSFDGSYVNYRHLSLLCDIMTLKGHFTAITRHGLNRGDKGVLSKASFEETVDILIEASTLAETDYLKGVSEPIILGQLCTFGTGSFDVLVDTSQLINAKDVNKMLGAGGNNAGNNMNNANSDMDYFYNMSTMEGNNMSTTMSYTVTNSNMNQQTTTAGNNNALLSLDVFSPIASSNFTKSNVFAKNKTGDIHFSPVSPFAQSQQQFGTQAGANMMTTHFSSNNLKQQKVYSPTSPFAASPVYNPAALSISSPMISLPGARRVNSNNNAMSPQYSPTSPHFSPTSPVYSPTSPLPAGPTSPIYSPTSPQYNNNPLSPMSPAYSPTSPGYQQRNAMMKNSGLVTSKFLPTSPQYSPTSPHFSPTSPIYSPTSPLPPTAQARQVLQATSPVYSPTSPVYSPTSPRYN